MKPKLSEERLQALRNREFKKFYVCVDDSEFICAADDALQALANFVLYELDRCATGPTEQMRFRPLYRVHEGQRDNDQFVSVAPVVWLNLLTDPDRAIICGRVQIHCHEHDQQVTFENFVHEVKERAPQNQTLFEFIKANAPGLAVAFKLITLDEMEGS